MNPETIRRELEDRRRLVTRTWEDEARWSTVPPSLLEQTLVWRLCGVPSEVDPRIVRCCAAAREAGTGYGHVAFDLSAWGLDASPAAIS